MSESELQPVIGLEVHCQLLTQTRLFSGGPVDFGASANRRVTAYDIGLPGQLPVLNRRAVDLALRVGLALGCTIHSRSRFDRKHYFYPDLPKGYQITQQRRPLCTGGRLKFDHNGRECELALRRIHLEEDAAKSVYDSAAEQTLIDFNRAGVPLIEVVTQPELSDPEQAESALRELHRLVVHLGVCDGNMQEGSFRCDANISLRRVDSGEPLPSPGPRVEVKNLNSFRFVRRALQTEEKRLRKLGEQRRQSAADETRSYDPKRDRTQLMRTKETSPDYRYVPDPDLPALRVSYDRLRQVHEELPELPRQRQRRWCEQFKLDAQNAATLVDPPQRARFFEQAVDAYPEDPVAVANFVVNELLGHVGEETVADLDITPGEVAEIVAMVDDGTISSSAASKVLPEVLRSADSPRKLVEHLDLEQLSDERHLGGLIDEILEQNPTLVQRYRDGERKLFGHFMGQVMQASSGRADPKIASEILRDRLEP